MGKRGHSANDSKESKRRKKSQPSCSSNIKKPSTSTKVNPKKSPKKYTDEFFDDKKEVSKKKHGVLKRYLGTWMALLSQNKFRTFLRSEPQYTRMVYVDGFSGPGIYSNGEYGSPAIAYELALTHQRIMAHGPDLCLIFIEKDGERCRQLVRNLRETRKGVVDARNDSKVKYMVIRGEFVRAMEWILSKHFRFPDHPKSQRCVYRVPTEERGGDSGRRGERFIGPMTPLLAFVDPFGFNGEHVPMTLMRRILGVSEKSEILLNLSTGGIQRFCKLDSRAKAINKLTGDDGEDSRWKEYVLNGNADGAHVIKRFIRYYGWSLCSESKRLMYVSMFEMRGSRNRLMYHLLSASQHKQAFKGMKNAMRKETQDEYSFKFSSFNQAKPTFLKNIVKDEEVVALVIEKFRGEVVAGMGITEFIDEHDTLTQRFRVALKRGLAKYRVGNGKGGQFDHILYDLRGVRGEGEEEEEEEEGDEGEEWWQDGREVTLGEEETNEDSDGNGEGDGGKVDSDDEDIDEEMDDEDDRSEDMDTDEDESD